MNIESECRNCGAALSGGYCSVCGQAADTSIPSLRQVILDVIGDLYSFDSRLWRSVIALLAFPGRLTRRFLEGQRVRYVPPFRMYLVSSLIFFLLVSLGGAPAGNFEADRQGPAPPADETPADPPDAAEQFEVYISPEGWGCNPPSGLSAGLESRWREVCDNMARSGTSFGSALASNIPIMMLLFIPVAAAGMKALYPRSRRKYVEHLLFFLHFHSFFFVLATLTMLLARARDALPAAGALVWLEIAAWVYLPVYLFLAMRHVYRQSRLATVAKLMLLVVGYSFGLLATFLAAAIYTALTL